MARGAVRGRRAPAGRGHRVAGGVGAGGGDEVRGYARQTEVAGAKLTSVPVPTPRYRNHELRERWEAIIARFVQLGDDSALVEVPQRKGKSIYDALVRSLKRMGEKRCYPTMRGGSVYLVRVPTNGERR